MADQELKFTLSAVTMGFTQKLQEAGNQVRTFSDSVVDKFKGIRDAIGNVGNIMAAMGAVRMVQLVDDATMVSARLKDVTGSAQEATAAKQQLFAMAQRLQVGYTELAGSVAKMLPAVQAMGGGTQEAMKLAEIMATTARMSGASAQEAAAAQTQFAQALASGVLQGDELKSILENNSAMARVMAEGLGVSVGELRKLGSEGKLTSDQVANALLGSYDQIKAKAAELPPTVGGAWTQVTNSFQHFLESLNSGTGALNAVASSLSEIARLLDAVAGGFSKADDASRKLEQGSAAVRFGRMVSEVFAGLVDLAHILAKSFAMVGRDLDALAASALSAASGDFSTAMRIMGDRAKELAKETQHLNDLWMGVGDSALGRLRSSRTPDAGGGRGFVNPTMPRTPLVVPGADTPPPKKTTGMGRQSAGPAAEPSDMPAITAELEATKLKYMQQNQLREMNKLEELKALEEISARYKLSAKDQIQLRKQVAGMEIAALKEMAEQGRQLDEGERKARQDKALNAVQSAQQEAREKLALGQITKAEMLQLDADFERQRNEIARQALAERLSQTDPTRDPVAYAQILAQIEQQEAEHQLRMQQIRTQAAVESNSTLNQMGRGLEGSFARVFSQIGTSITSISGLFRGMATAILQTFVQMLAQMAAKWLVNKLLMKAMSKAAALGEIATEAGKAGAGGVASMAAAPFPLNLGAPAFGASMAAAAMAFAPMASAAGGFDIPAGTNPITQLHAREMVLPAKHADVIRQLADQGGAGGAGGGINVTYNDHSGQLDEATIRRHGRVLAETLERQHRNGWRPAR